MSEYNYSGNPTIQKNIHKNELQQQRISSAAAAPSVDMNKAVKTVLEQHKHQLNSLSAIMRCDQLPFVAGSQSNIEALFNLLFQMIFEQSAPGRSLLIHLKTKAELNEQQGGYQLYNISFHTNVLPGSYIKDLYKTRLEECALICKQLGGSFEEQFHSKTGCLFNIKIPGKLF